jgi:hypothetical protein
VSSKRLTANRLAYRVFTTDCMNTLFFKASPQITVAEMCGDLPSTDAMFEAANSTEYERLVATSADPESRSGRLKDLVTLFLGENWPRPDSSDLTAVETGHLMSLIFGPVLPSSAHVSALANYRQPFIPSFSCRAPDSSCHRRDKYWSAPQVVGKSFGKS